MDTALAYGLSADTIKWKPRFTVEKWNQETLEKNGLFEAPSALLRANFIPPDDVISGEGNLLLNAGITEMLELITATGTTTAFDNTNARIGVGDSSTAAAATQTDLQASTNKTYKGMNASYPSVSAQTAQWQSDFTTSEANYAWEEWVIDNGGTALVRMNRKVASLGTKASGTWTFTVDITLS